MKKKESHTISCRVKFSNPNNFSLIEIIIEASSSNQFLLISPNLDKPEPKGFFDRITG